MTTAPSADVAPSWAELQRRLVFTMLRPAMGLCRLFHLPLSTVEDLARMAYFEEVRFRGQLSQAQAAFLMNRSLRTVGNLERRYRSDFLAPEAELTLVREVEEAFAAAPASIEEVSARLPNLEPADVSRSVASLVAMGRLTLDDVGPPALYALNHDFVSLLEDDLDTQLDGLRHQLDVVASAVRERFMETEPTALARTLAFVARDEDMEALGDDIVRHLRERCIDIEERALKNGSYERYAVTFAMAPMDHERER